MGWGLGLACETTGTPEHCSAGKQSVGLDEGMSARGLRQSRIPCCQSKKQRSAFFCVWHSSTACRCLWFIVLAEHC